MALIVFRFYLALSSRQSKTFYICNKMLRGYLQKLLVPLLASWGSATADFHLSHLTLQFGSSPLTVSEPALGISQPQQLLLQQTVLPLQQGQLSDGRPCVHLRILSVSPGEPSHPSRRYGHVIVGLQQELQDGVLLNNCSLQDRRMLILVLPPFIQKNKGPSLAIVNHHLK